MAEAVTPVDEPAETPAAAEPPGADAPIDAEARVVEAEPIVVPSRRANRDWSRPTTSTATRC